MHSRGGKITKSHRVDTYVAILVNEELTESTYVNATSQSLVTKN